MNVALRIRSRNDGDRAASNARSTRSARPRLAVVRERSVLRRVTPTAVIAVLVVTVFAFGALAAHISLFAEQRKLDHVRTAIVAEQNRQEVLRRSESRLQSPDEVIRIATTDLGMVASARAEILAPARGAIGVTTPAPPSVLARSTTPAPSTTVPRSR